MKVPAHQYDATVCFYRDVLGFRELTEFAPDTVFEFGPNRLWIDRVPHLSQAEVWLEVLTDDLSAAAAHLAGAGVVRCDEIEPLPDGLQAFWISNPAAIIHLVHGEAGSPGDPAP